VALHVGVQQYRGCPDTTAALVAARLEAAPFRGGLDRAKSRFTGILSELGLQTPKELSQ